MHNSHFHYQSPKWQAPVTPADQAFILESGQKLINPWQLRQFIVNSTPDDWEVFHAQTLPHILFWINTSVGDSILAQTLKPARSFWQLLVLLERHQIRLTQIPPYLANRWLSPNKTSLDLLPNLTVSSLIQLAQELSNFPQTHPQNLSSWIQHTVGDYQLAELLEYTPNTRIANQFIQDRVEYLHHCLD